MQTREIKRKLNEKISLLWKIQTRKNQNVSKYIKRKVFTKSNKY